MGIRAEGSKQCRRRTAWSSVCVAGNRFLSRSILSVLVCALFGRRKGGELKGERETGGEEGGEGEEGEGVGE